MHLLGGLPKQRVRHVLIALGHGRRGPAHDRHDDALGYAEEQEDRGGGVAGVVEAGVADAGFLEELLPVVVVGVGDQGLAGR
jgi:hypothetical protein